MEQINKFDFLQELLRKVDGLQIEDIPANELAFIYKEGHSSALNDVMNLIRREM